MAFGPAIVLWKREGRVLGTSHTCNAIGLCTTRVMRRQKFRKCRPCTTKVGTWQNFNQAACGRPKAVKHISQCLTLVSMAPGTAMLDVKICSDTSCTDDRQPQDLYARLHMMIYQCLVRHQTQYIAAVR